ncbi:MAG TPA: hypothetical protein VHY37_07320 [Tepidisphaeraceae bacterium]|jgi:hypothetical protein|nr:hypothetical protein [Tepidisphaeraceae bacterium]
MAGGNWRKKVNQGDKLSIPAFWFNDVTETMLSHQRSRQRLRAEGIKSPMPEGLVWVQNNSGATVNRFGVMGMSGVIINDSANLAEFQNNWALTGVTPTAAYIGKFVIAWEPIATGAIGRAFISGTCPVQITMNNAGDKFADVKDGDATQLTSGASGAAQILYNGSGTGGPTWAIARLGDAGDRSALITLTSTATDSGAYNATLNLPPTADVPAGSTLASTDFGSAGKSVLALNTAEVGLSGHQLDTTGTYLPLTFPAFFLRTNSSGTDVYGFWGVQDEACS